MKEMSKSEGTIVESSYYIEMPQIQCILFLSSH